MESPEAVALKESWMMPTGDSHGSCPEQPGSQWVASLPRAQTQTKGERGTGLVPTRGWGKCVWEESVPPTGLCFRLHPLISAH